MTDNHVDALQNVQQFRVPFGIGCWDFGLRREGPFKLELKEFLSSLKEGLESDSSLNNLEIYPRFKKYEFSERSLRESKFGTGVFPGQSLRRIKFDLYIPSRIQQELIGPNYRASDTNTQNFRVHMYYPYHGPVAFVELLDENNFSRSSTAVQVVREYMDSRLNKSPSNLVFSFVGPSPFHAEFQIEGHSPLTGTEALYECKTTDRPGYPDITFQCTTDNFANASVASEQLFHTLEDELSLFYRIHRSDVQKLKHWRDIEKNVSEVTELYNKTSRCQRLHFPWSRGRDLVALPVSIVAFEKNHIVNDHHMKTGNRKIYQGKEFAFLKGFLESALKDRPIFPTRQMSELVEFIEKRRSRNLESLMVLIAAVTGALIGASIALLAR